ncbi:hypothetical protein Pmani_007750 [Petrolisthes manimaculis]|uniref:Uncharacterized protein n=1 Tax=Petrolisthes manimaculis TaxID=1843537 RepID=A0AAE1Q8A4_9EUCA|nr:hypothetical protein Pmani_007750 [Petrolisthes manimaculis]
MTEGGRNIMVEVRERLDYLGYHEPLSPHSLPLVQHLLKDLLANNKQLSEAQTQLTDLKKRCEDGENSVVPYKEENGRLLTQLNQLHMDNITLKEHTLKQGKELSNALEKLEEDCEGLKLLLCECQRREEELKAESAKKSEKIIQLQQRNLKPPVITTPRGGKVAVPLHRQRLEITSHLPPNTMSSVFKCSNCGREETTRPNNNNNNNNNKDDSNKNDSNKTNNNNNNNDVYLADLLRMTDHKLMELQREAEDSRRQTKLSHEQCTTLKKQIETREAEIGRLQTLLEGGRESGVVVGDNRFLAAHTHIHHLQLHNDLLTKTNLQLEAKLKHILGDTHDAMSRAVELADVNTDLTTELHHTQLDAHSTTHTLTHQLNHTTSKLLQCEVDLSEPFLYSFFFSFSLSCFNSKLLQCEGDLSEQHRLYHLVKDERDRLYRELVQVRHDYTRLSHHHTTLITERGPMEEQLRLGQEEKKTLIDKINRLTVSLQEMEADKLRLSMDGDTLRRSITELKVEKETQNRKIAQLTDDNTSNGLKLTQLQEEKDTQNIKILQLNDENTAQSLRITQLHEDKEALEQGKAFYSSEAEKLTNQGRELEQERNYYKEEMIKGQTLISTMEQERDFYKDKSGEVTRDKQALEEAQTHLGDDYTRIQTQLKQMQHERNYFSEQLNQTQGEKRQAEREREYYSEQVVQLLDLLKTKPPSTPSTPLQISRPRTKTVSPETELARVMYERDVLRQERDFYKSQYHSVRNQQGAGSGASLASGSGSGGAGGVQPPPPTHPQAPPPPPPPLAPTTTSTAPPSVPMLVPGMLPGTPPARPQSVPTSGVDIEAIKRERDFFRQQMEYFRQQLNNTRSGPTTAAVPVPQPPPPHHGPPLSAPSLDSDRPPHHRPPPPLTRGSSDTSPRMDSDPETRRGEMRMYQQEREFYRQQYENLKATLSQPTPPQGEEVDIASVARQRDFLQQERDFYRTQYNDISRRLAQITSTPNTVPQTIRQEMEALMAEKRGANIAKADLEAQVRILSERLTDSERERNEIDSHTRELHTAIEKLQDAAAQKFPPATQSFIMEIRKARDSAMADLEKAKKERDQLREKMRTSTTQQVREKASLEEETSNLRRQTEEGSRQTSDLTQRLHSQGALIASLQDQVVGLQNALQQSHDQLGMQGKESDDIKKLLEKKVGEAGDTAHQLEFRLGQLGEAETRAQHLEGELGRVKAELSQTRTELATLRNSLTRLDHDKDLLSTEVDTRTQHLVALREELRRREAACAQLEANVAKLEGKLE